MKAKEILEWYESDNNNPIFAYMFGKPYRVANLGGRCSWRKDDIIDIEKKRLILGANKDCFFFVWGLPGPDYNIYEFSDYGITWAFTKKELEENVPEAPKNRS